MNEYKIEVANEAESKEAQELFFELGYEWLGEEKSIQHTKQRYLFISGNYRITFAPEYYLEYFNKSHYQQITLPELRTLALIKRNDVNDATHIDKDGDKWFISGGDYYLFDSYDGWLKLSLSDAKNYKAKPITHKNEITLTEALERFKNNLPVEAKYSEVWESIDIHDSIDTLLKATAFRVPAPNSITLNGTEYTEEEALKLIWNHFND